MSATGLDLTQPYYKFIEYINANSVTNTILSFKDAGVLKTYFIDSKGNVTLASEFDGIDDSIAEKLGDITQLIDDKTSYSPVADIATLKLLVGMKTGEQKNIVINDKITIYTFVESVTVPAVGTSYVLADDGTGYWITNDITSKAVVIAKEGLTTYTAIGPDGNKALVGATTLMAITLPVGKELSAVTNATILNAKTGLISVQGTTSIVDGNTVIEVGLTLGNATVEIEEQVALVVKDAVGNILQATGTRGIQTVKGVSSNIFITLPAGKLISAVTGGTIINSNGIVKVDGSTVLINSIESILVTVTLVNEIPDLTGVTIDLDIIV